MGLWVKLSDVLRADLNALLDKATDPMKQLNLMIADMHDFRQNQAQNIGNAMVALSRTKADLSEANLVVVRWGKRAESATKHGNDSDARSALTQQIEQEKLVKTLEAAVNEQQMNIENLKTDLASLDRKIEEVESKRSVVEVRVRTAEAQIGIHGPISSHGRAPNINEVLDRVENSVRQKEAGAAVAGEVADLAPQSAEERFSASETGDEVERRLAALKEKK